MSSIGVSSRQLWRRIDQMSFAHFPFAFNPQLSLRAGGPAAASASGSPRSNLFNRAHHSAGFDRSAVLHQDLG
jgi:hypothetical protein